MPCSRPTQALPAWGLLYIVVAAALMALAVVPLMMSGHPLLEKIGSGFSVLILFGAMKMWVHANRAALALSAERRCCTLALRVRVIEPIAATREESAESELVGHPG